MGNKKRFPGTSHTWRDFFMDTDDSEYLLVDIRVAFKLELRVTLSFLLNSTDLLNCGNSYTFAWRMKSEFQGSVGCAATDYFKKKKTEAIFSAMYSIVSNCKILFRDLAAMVHLLKCSIGNGILFLPNGFRRTGYVMSLICSVMIGLLCTHTVVVLVGRPRTRNGKK